MTNIHANVRPVESMEDRMAEKAGKKEKIPRQPMPEQAPEVRKRNFEEVPFGYTPELAVKEAERCLQCKNPSCIEGCPVAVDIPGFIKLIKEHEFTKSIRKIWERNSLPAVCGRVCPQEIQCEEVCALAKKEAPIAIGRLENHLISLVHIINMNMQTTIYRSSTDRPYDPIG